MKLFRIGTSGSRDVILKILLILISALAAPLAEQNHLCKFGRGHHDEPSCEIILILDHWCSQGDVV